MQSIPKRGFNISKFYDSLKIDSDMFRPFKIIDDTINVQDQGIYISIYIYFFQTLLIVSVCLCLSPSTIKFSFVENDFRDIC